MNIFEHSSPKLKLIEAACLAVWVGWACLMPGLAELERPAQAELTGLPEPGLSALPGAELFQGWAWGWPESGLELAGAS